MCRPRPAKNRDHFSAWLPAGQVGSPNGLLFVALPVALRAACMRPTRDRQKLPASPQMSDHQSLGQFTVCEIEPVLPLKLAVAAYVAVTVSVPAGKVVTANRALPAARVAFPSVVDPSVNVTLPVGVA